MDSPRKPAPAIPYRGDAVDATQGRLSRIADLVGCPVETFTHGSDAEIAGAAELLEFWLAIEDTDNRRKVLAFARSLARS